MNYLNSKAFGTLHMAMILVAVLCLGASNADAKKADKTKIAAVDCNAPNSSIQDAIDNATGPTEITFSGTCTENLTIETDDITLRGQTATDTVDGYIVVRGAHRVDLSDFTLVGTVSGDTGLFALEGAAINASDMTIDGDLGGGNYAENGVGVFHNSLARVFNTTIRNAITGAIAFNNSSIEVRDSSTIEDSTETAFQAGQGSSGRLLDSTIMMKAGSIVGAFAERQSVLTIQSSTITDGPVNTTEGPVLINEGSFARIEDSTITANNSDPNSGLGALQVIRSSARLRGDGNDLSNSGGGAVIDVTSGNLVQDHGHADISGFVEIGVQSVAQFLDVEISGDMTVYENSVLRFRNLSGDALQVTVDGDIDVDRDSMVGFSAFGGGQTVKVTGALTCVDTESRWFETVGGLAVIGANTCTSF